MEILFDKNYPKYVVDAIQLIHKLDSTKYFNVSQWTKEVKETQNKPVIFILDRSTRGIDVTTQKHYEEGYRVFAFKLNGKSKIEFFRFALTVLNIWPKVLETVKTEQEPFIYTYKYGGRKLTKILQTVNQAA